MFKESSIILSTLTVLILAEISVSGPYPPSNWRPQGAPFELPTQQPIGLDIEIAKERIDFAGQFSDTITSKPKNEYLPPQKDLSDRRHSNEDFLKVQGLPSEDIAKFTEQSNDPLNIGEVPRQFEKFGQTERHLSVNQHQSRTPQHPQINEENQNHKLLPALQQPNNEYGSPLDENINGADRTDSDEFIYQSGSNFNNEEFRKESTQDYNNSENASKTVTNGQYYVLSKDKTLQRVIFMTSQDADQARSNGFTAQLRYMLVEPIRDPIYAYNDQGQLVRIFKK